VTDSKPPTGEIPAVHLATNAKVARWEWAHLAAAAIGSCLLALNANAHPIEVYQDGGRLGVARPVVECIGPHLSCSVASGGQLRMYADAGSSGGGLHDYLLGTFTAAQNTNRSEGDHLKFNSVVASSGTSITLDTTTGYTNAANVASVGRFTLTANNTYRIDFNPTYIDLGGTGGYVVLALWDADASAQIGNRSFYYAATGTSHIAGSGIFTTIYTPGSDKRVEVRIIEVNSPFSATDVSQIGTNALFSNSALWPTLLIKRLD
jgi:hypothetical protein